MISDDQNNQTFDIDPSMVVLGLGYATTLMVAVGWLAALVI